MSLNPRAFDLKTFLRFFFLTLVVIWLLFSGTTQFMLLGADTSDPVFERTIVSYGVYGEGEQRTVTYQYRGDRLPPLLEANEVIEKRTESSYTKRIGTTKDGRAVYQLIAYSDKTFVQEGGVWFARETDRTSYNNFSLVRRANPVTSLFWERAYADAISPFAEAGDGRVEARNSSWAATHAETTGDTVDVADADASIVASTHLVTTYSIYRGFLPFNTSAIPADSSVSAATLNVYVTGKTNGDNDGDDYVTVVQTSQADHTTLTTADVEQVGSVEGYTGAALDITDMATSAYLSIPLNATGLTWIALSGDSSNCSATEGITCLGLREGHDFENASITSNQTNSINASMSETTGTSQDPYLEVTYTEGGGCGFGEDIGGGQCRGYLTSDTSWDVPDDWNSSDNSIEVIGGGAGGTTSNDDSWGAGGGGGGYSRIDDLSLTPGGSVTYAVGAGSPANTAGGDTYFNGASCGAASVCAKGGAASTNEGQDGGLGGAAGSGVGTTKTSGGTGGSGDSAQTGSGGGGGGAGGPDGNGAVGGAADDSSGGGGGGANGGATGQDSGGSTPGAGGNGPNASGAGAAGSPNGGAGSDGGGGGGGDDTGAGGAGGAGTEFDATHGAGGGGGGAGEGNTSNGGDGGLYGGGGGGGGYNGGTGGDGGQGLIVITYTPEGGGGGGEPTRVMRLMGDVRLRGVRLLGL